MSMGHAILAIAIWLLVALIMGVSLIGALSWYFDS